MNHNIFALAVFICAYVLFVLLPSKRTPIAVASALVLIFTKTITLKEAFISINWNVMAIFVGTLIIADIFMESRVPAYIAQLIVDKAKNTGWAILYICLLTGFISAFVENVATVLIVAPIALSLAKKLKINPMNMMIAIALSSNIQGTATLIGDPPSMLLGGFAKMNFWDFFFYKGRPSIFFAVELGALASFIVLYFVFRNHKEKVIISEIDKIKSWVPTIILVVLIFALAASSFFDTGFSYMAGVLCMIFGIISIIWEKFVNKSSIIKGIKSLDWQTTFFLMGIFIVVGSITLTGWIEVISNFLSGLIKGNIFLGYTLVVFISVFLSAFIDNVPFLAAMLPVAISMAAKLQINPSLFLFGLLIGASLGGNVTPIGASANIVACGLLKKEGYEVKFKDFVKIGLPFTLVAVSAAYLFVWFVWGK
ncbi:MAG: SLC13 family permease [Candidatus Omnitrophica bacterium]|nr:SLC13 family permease [Candidatus Omnitrophota bacterium]MDD5352773.1 SLC13 family permease [Candidatus Omnitrophota bacterium]MDD5550372.1 SLC13 family permease [Candidatus Omnitrophota bacterium]